MSSDGNGEDIVAIINFLVTLPNKSGANYFHHPPVIDAMLDGELWWGSSWFVVW